MGHDFTTWLRGSFSVCVLLDPVLAVLWNVTNRCPSTVPIQSLQAAKYAPSFLEACSLRPFYQVCIRCDLCVTCGCFSIHGLWSCFSVVFLPVVAVVEVSRNAVVTQHAALNPSSFDLLSTKGQMTLPLDDGVQWFFVEFLLFLRTGSETHYSGSFPHWRHWHPGRKSPAPWSHYWMLLKPGLNNIWMTTCGFVACWMCGDQRTSQSFCRWTPAPCTRLLSGRNDCVPPELADRRIFSKWLGLLMPRNEWLALFQMTGWLLSQHTYSWQRRPPHFVQRQRGFGH